MLWEHLRTTKTGSNGIPRSAGSMNVASARRIRNTIAQKLFVLHGSFMDIRNRLAYAQRFVSVAEAHQARRLLPWITITLRESFADGFAIIATSELAA